MTGNVLRHCGTEMFFTVLFLEHVDVLGVELGLEKLDQLVNGMTSIQDLLLYYKYHLVKTRCGL